jgi:hypothetical protein
VGCRREARWLLLSPCCSCPLVVHEKKAGGRRREEKREKRKEVKEKTKGKNGKQNSNMAIFEKIKDNL